MELEMPTYKPTSYPPTYYGSGASLIRIVN